MVAPYNPSLITHKADSFAPVTAALGTKRRENESAREGERVTK